MSKNLIKADCFSETNLPMKSRCSGYEPAGLEPTSQCNKNFFDLPALAKAVAGNPIFAKPVMDKVEDIGVEPMTLCVQGRCSSQLS